MLKALIIVAIILVIVLGNLYLIAPNEKRDCSKFKGLMFAHRGLHEPGVPENSPEAFRRAKAEGYGVELDVQYTADGKIVVFHDGNLSRMCGVDKKVADCTYEELMEYRLDGTEERIPLFKDVLEILQDRPLVCEIKNHNGNINDNLCRETYELLETYGGDYCIESFSPFLVKWFRDNAPEVIRGQLSCDLKEEKSLGPVARFVMSNLLVNVISRPDFLAYRHKDINKIGYRICSKLYKPLLVAWTARGEAEQVSAWKNFDSIIFEKYANDNPVE